MKKIILSVSILAIFAGCYNDKYDKLYPSPVTTTCDTTSISYAHDILPILNTSCNTSNCHDAGGGTSGLDFTIFSVLQGQATADLMLNDINGTLGRGNHAMPKDLPKLAQCDINKITRWVNQGAPNN